MKQLWTMKDGKSIKIEDMTDSHIENCLNGLKKGKHFSTLILSDDIMHEPGVLDTSSEWVNIFEKEMRLRELAKINNNRRK